MSEPWSGLEVPGHIGAMAKDLSRTRMPHSRHRMSPRIEAFQGPGPDPETRAQQLGFVYAAACRNPPTLLSNHPQPHSSEFSPPEAPLTQHGEGEEEEAYERNTDGHLSAKQGLQSNERHLIRLEVHLNSAIQRLAGNLSTVSSAAYISAYLHQIPVEGKRTVLQNLLTYYALMARWQSAGESDQHPSTTDWSDCHSFARVCMQLLTPSSCLMTSSDLSQAERTARQPSPTNGPEDSCISDNGLIPPEQTHLEQTHLEGIPEIACDLPSNGPPAQSAQPRKRTPGSAGLDQDTQQVSQDLCGDPAQGGSPHESHRSALLQEVIREDVSPAPEGNAGFANSCQVMQSVPWMLAMGFIGVVPT